MTRGNSDDDHTIDHNTVHEELLLTQEESIPSDGKDVEGEELMKSVRNDLLTEQPPAD
jgi:hypothetical protein